MFHLEHMLAAVETMLAAGDNRGPADVGLCPDCCDALSKAGPFVGGDFDADSIVIGMGVALTMVQHQTMRQARMN